MTSYSNKVRVTRQRSETKAKRIAKWDDNFIPCRNHPEVRCLKSAYVHNRHRRCAYCHSNLGSKKRAKLWDTTIILCAACRFRRCGRSGYVKRRRRWCAHCWRTLSPDYYRYKHSPQGLEQSNAAQRSRKLAQRIMENRI